MQLNIPLKQLLAIIGGRCDADPNFVVGNISSLQNARSNDISIAFDPEDNSVFDPVSKNDIKLSRAGLIIASNKVVDDKNFILVDDPLKAFHILANYAQKNESSGVHESAVLHETVIIEEGVSIGANCVVEKGARVGFNSRIGAQVFIGEGARISNNVTIYPGAKILSGTIIGEHTIVHSGAILGSDGFGYRATKQGMLKVPQVGIVRVGKYAEIGANVCIDRAAFDETVIGDNVKIDNQVHIAHNVQVGPHTAIIAQTGIAGSAKIGAGCMIGGQVGIKDHVTIGNGVKIVSKSGVLRNVQDGEIIAGAPSMPFGKWKRCMAAMTQLPELLRSAKDIKSKLGDRKSIWNRLFGR